MVTIEYMIEVALRCDTIMSRAMLEACGVPQPARPVIGRPRKPSGGYDGVAECFRNLGSPMDGRPWL